uniref:Uncharacterized protein n=1 Tax=Ciona intestinalis TaxID=7719 RepID=H2XUA4_CIOIN
MRSFDSDGVKDASIHVAYFCVHCRDILSCSSRLVKY